MKNLYNINNKITLEQLASHTSGLFREAPCDLSQLTCNITLDEAIERLKNM